MAPIFIPRTLSVVRMSADEKEVNERERRNVLARHPCKAEISDMSIVFMRMCPTSEAMDASMTLVPIELHLICSISFM